MKGNTVLKLLFVLLVAVFAGHQIYASVYKPIMTESALYYESVDGLQVTGVIIRQEHLVTCDTPGVLHFLVSDGSRVARGGTIAGIYDSQNASIVMSEIDALNAQIADITELQGYNNLQATDLDLVNSRVGLALNGLISGCAGGNYSDARENADTLLSAINRRQIITGEQTDFSAQLGSLNTRLSELTAALPAAKGNITATQSGYFSSSTDGYEQVLTVDDLSRVTSEFLADMNPQPVPDNVVGKIVSDYEWYIAAKMTMNDSLRYKEGDTLVIRTALKSNPTLDVTVRRINLSNGGDSAVVIFSCSQMSSQLASMRTGPMTVVSTIHSGLRISKSALRVVDQQTGVYVLSGITLKFLPVKVIYSEDRSGYIICEQEQSTSDVLRLYDEVVVKGKNLYDGKIVG